MPSEPKPLPEPAEDRLHDTDFYTWTGRQAELLRAGRLDEADMETIAEEIEDLGSKAPHGNEGFGWRTASRERKVYEIEALIAVGAPTRRLASKPPIG